jgi:hypothetical protein
MFAARAIALPLVLTLGFLAAGCIVENEHSIIDRPAAVDARLAGVWALESSGNAQLLALQPREEGEHRLQAIFVIVGGKDEPVMTSRAVVTFLSITGRSYFEASWKAGEWLPLDPPVRRSFGTYELAGAAGAETLRVCFADPASFEGPIKGGALAGYSGAGRDYERRTVLAADGAALRAYLAKNEFKCPTPSVYRRLTGPAQPR